MKSIKDLVLKFMPKKVLIYIKAVRYIYNVGRFSESDEPELRVVKHLVRPGNTVVDVGANVGWYTRYLSNIVGQQGRVISLEPMPETFALLSICVRWYRLSNVVLFNVGASESNKSAVMHVPRYDSGGDNFYRAHVVDDGLPSDAMHRREVKLRSLDSLLGENVHDVAFIKCDVEGHELELIKGSCETIKAQKAAWLIEVTRTSDPDIDGTNSYQIFQALGTHGYTPWWLDGNRLRRRKKGDHTLNYFFLLPQHLSILKSSRLVLDM
jgi:FkbM family methyltransferase